MMSETNNDIQGEMWTTLLTTFKYPPFLWINPTKTLRNSNNTCG